MPESYVRPVVRATEPPPAWIAVWRFRLALLIALALGALLIFRIYIYFSGANRQDPSFEGRGSMVAASTHHDAL